MDKLIAPIMQFLEANFDMEKWPEQIVVNLIATGIWAAGIGLAILLYRSVRSSSADFRKDREVQRIIKIYVYRKHMGKKTINSLARGEFYVLFNVLRYLIIGLVLISMGGILTSILPDEIFAIPFWIVAILVFIQAGIWLSPNWANQTVDKITERALAEASSYLGVTAEEIRSVVTAPHVKKN